MKIGFVTDPLHHMDTHIEGTISLMAAAQKRGWEIYQMEPTDLSVVQGKPYATVVQLQEIKLDGSAQWWRAENSKQIPLSKLDILVMRKDPPFDMDYIHTTYILELAEKAGVFVTNKPQSLRDFNEKMSTQLFPHCIPETLVSANMENLKGFVAHCQDVILKPFDRMGGASIFRMKVGDPNLNVTLELMTNKGRHSIMAQRYIPEVKEGDRRIILLDGQPIPFVYARYAALGETRANISAGGSGKSLPISDREKFLCEQVGPMLKAKGLLLVGVDVIGEYITEINVTSPGCIRELEELTKIDIAGQWCEALLKYCKKL